MSLKPNDVPNTGTLRLIGLSSTTGVGQSPSLGTAQRPNGVSMNIMFNPSSMGFRTVSVPQGGSPGGSTFIPAITTGSISTIATPITGSGNIIAPTLVGTGTLSASIPAGIYSSIIAASIAPISCTIKIGGDIISTAVDLSGVPLAVATALLTTPANKLATDITGRVTVGINADKAGYSISGTKQTLDVLHDAPALTQRSEPPSTSSIVTAMQDNGTFLKDLHDVKPAYTPDVTSTGEIGIDLTNVKLPSSPTVFTNVTIPLVSDITTKSGYSGTATNMVTQPDNTNIGLIKVIVDKLNTMMMADGITNYKFTVDSLVNAPVTESTDITGLQSDITTIKDQTNKIHFTGDDIKATLDGETVTASSVTDKAGYSISGTKQTLDALQDAIQRSEPPTADAIAAKILKTPVNLITTDSNGAIPSSNAPEVDLSGIPVAVAEVVLADPAHPLIQRSEPDNTNIGLIKAVIDKMNTLLEADGIVYRFTVNSLENAPTGGGTGGGGLTQEEHDILYGIDENVDSIKLQTDKMNFTGVDIKATLDLEKVVVSSIDTNVINASSIATDAITEIQTGLATSSNLAVVDTVVDAIKLKTDSIPTNPLLTTDSRLNNLDATVSSRLANSNYTDRKTHV